MNIFSRLAFAPLYTQLVVTRQCNLSCGYCNEFDKISAPVSLQALQERLQLLKRLGALSVCFTGGEPTLHPELDELIHYARFELGFFQVAMISNGFLLTPQKIQSYNRAGLQALQISVDGVHPNDVTVKVLKSLREKLFMLKNEAKFEVIVSGVYGAASAPETEEVIHFAKELGFRPRVLFLHGFDGQIQLSAEQIESYTKIKTELATSWFDLGNATFQKQILKGQASSFKCRAGSRYLYVDEFGLVRWCSQTKDLFQKPLADYTPNDLREQFYKPKPCQDNCTLGCVRSASILDGWRAQIPA